MAITMVPVEKKENEKRALGEVLVDGIQKNRKALLILVVGIAVLIIVFAVGVGVYTSMRAGAVAEVEAYASRYEGLKLDINDPAKEADVTALRTEVNDFAVKTAGYAGSRAWSIAANISADQDDWAAAESAWANAADRGKKTHLAPVALFNAAVAAEQQGNLSGAIAYYLRCLEYAGFTDASHAQFSIGRLREAEGNPAAAIAAYQAVIDSWPSETWANLARSRIIALNIAP